MAQNIIISADANHAEIHCNCISWTSFCYSESQSSDKTIASLRTDAEQSEFVIFGKHLHKIKLSVD